MRLSTLTRTPADFPLLPSALGGAALLVACLAGCSAPANDDGGGLSTAPTTTTTANPPLTPGGMFDTGATGAPAPTSDTIFAAGTEVNVAGEVPVIGNAVCGGSNIVGTLRDFTDQHPDFENLEEKGRFYGFEPGIVGTTITADRKPPYVGGIGRTTSGPENFSQWYSTVDGVNQVIFYALEFTPSASGTSVFDSAPFGGFFPIDNMLFGNGPFPPGTTTYTHNYHFTFEFHTRFAYNPGDVFTFRGDDDVWVYINDQLVCDLGGVHAPLTCEVALDTLGLVSGEEYLFDFFFAERHIIDANFRIETNLIFQECNVLR